MSAQLLAEGPPRGVDIAIQKSFLDCDQQVISQQAEENVRLGAPLEVMEDGPLHQRALHGPKSRFHPGQQNVSFPDLVVGPILAVALEQVAAV